MPQISDSQAAVRPQIPRDHHEARTLTAPTRIPPTSSPFEPHELAALSGVIGLILRQMAERAAREQDLMQAVG